MPEEHAANHHGEHLSDGHDDGEDDRPKALDRVEDEQLPKRLKAARTGGEGGRGVSSTHLRECHVLHLSVLSYKVEHHAVIC